MPKTKRPPEDVPVWYAMITEFNDPRPYEPAVPTFSKSHQPSDEPFIDPDYFDDLLYELTLEVEQASDAFDGYRELADEAMDKIWPWPWPGLRQQSLDPVTKERALTLLGSHDAPTIVMPRVDLSEMTIEIPAIKSPSADTEN